MGETAKATLQRNEHTGMGSIWGHLLQWSIITFWSLFMFQFYTFWGAEEKGEQINGDIKAQKIIVL